MSAQTTWLSNQYKSIVKKTGLKTKLPLIRQEISTIETIHTLILIFEAFGLRAYTLPWVLATTPEMKQLRAPAVTMWVPAITNLASNNFWAPTTLWLLTSLIVPAMAGYVLNLTYSNPRPKTRRTHPLREIDPLVFSIVKGLLAWAVYPQGASFRFGYYSPETVAIVNDYVYGGYTSMLIGSFIGIITALYDGLSFKS